MLPRVARTKQSVVRLGATEVVRIGASRGYLNDLYHFFLTRSWLGLLGLLAALDVAANLIFGAAYLLGGDCIENARPGSFADAFFFSVQTLATIGYGQMAPRTPYAHGLVAAEAFLGMLWLAMMTGLVFAKFSRPTARVLFSRVAILGMREGKPTFMLRMANERGNQIVEAHLRMVLIRSEVTSDGEPVRHFYELPLARASNVVFMLTWTGMHPITPESPLHGATLESLRAQGAQIIVSLMGIDETSSQTVHARKVYTVDDLVEGVRFVDILSRRPDGRSVIDYTRFHDVVKMPTGAEGTLGVASPHL
jgi:inward rectifier potassium channel